MTELVLASLSPFRGQLLKQLTTRFSQVPSPFDENTVQVDDPEDNARKRAQGKARQVASEHPGAVVIGADQVLGFQGHILTKPNNEEEARQRLAELAGKSHTLFSAVSLWLGRTELKTFCVTVSLTMRPLSDAEINTYVGSGEWQGCVGAYRVEGRGILLFSEVSGEHSAIIGLPLIELGENLRGLGVDLLQHPNGPWQIK